VGGGVDPPALAITNDTGTVVVAPLAPNAIDPA
jgi:hypothetical protein